MASKAQIKASNEYNKKNVKQLLFKLNKTTDRDIIEWLETVDSKQGYIKKLIRRNMEENKMKYKLMEENFEATLKFYGGEDVMETSVISSEMIKGFETLQEAEAELKKDKYIADIEKDEVLSKTYHIQRYVIEYIENEEVEVVERENVLKPMLDMED